jgi:hypothetical protein
MPADGTNRPAARGLLDRNYRSQSSAPLLHADSDFELIAQQTALRLTDPGA